MSSLAYPTVLAKYGIAQVKDHRKVGRHLNVKDVLSKYAQQREDFRVESLDGFDEEESPASGKSAVVSSHG